MSYKVTEEGNITTVHLDGEIDMDVTEKAKEVIFPHIDAGKEVHLNLSNVQYMDSSGISVLIESHQKALEKNTKVIIKDVIRPSVIIHPKSMIGFISLNMRDKKAQIVVKAVYIIGQNILFVVIEIISKLLNSGLFFLN